MSTASHIPSPRGNYWLFGHLFEMRKSRDILQTFAEWAKIYGPVVEFRPLGVFGKHGKLDNIIPDHYSRSDLL